MATFTRLLQMRIVARRRSLSSRRARMRASTERLRSSISLRSDGLRLKKAISLPETNPEQKRSKRASSRAKTAPLPGDCTTTWEKTSLRYGKKDKRTKTVRFLSGLLILRCGSRLGCQHLHGIGPHFGHITLHAVAVVVAAGVNLTFDIEFVAFVHILLDRLCQSAPQHNAVPFGMVGHLGPVLQPIAALGRCQPDAGNANAGIHIPHLGVGSHIPNQHYFVHTRFCFFNSCCHRCGMNPGRISSCKVILFLINLQVFLQFFYKCFPGQRRPQTSFMFCFNSAIGSFKSSNIFFLLPEILFLTRTYAIFSLQVP